MDSSITCINSTVDKMKMFSMYPADVKSNGVTNQREILLVWVGEVVVLG